MAKATSKKQASLHHPHDPIEVRTERERDHDTGTFRRRTTFFTIGRTMTEQHHKPNVDINNIMIRYMKTGTLDHVQQYNGQYGETPAGDFHDAMNLISESDTMFDDLPSQLRRHFSNDVTEFLSFCTSHDDPGGELTRIAESLRKAALGIDPPAGGDEEQQRLTQRAARSGESGERASDAGQGSPASGDAK